MKALSDLPGRLAVAIPGIAVLLACVSEGGAPFAALVAIAAGIAGFEAAKLLSVEGTPAALIGALCAAVVVAGAIDGREAVLGAVSGAFVSVGVFAIFRLPAGRRVAFVAAGALAVAWIGAGLAHGVLLRDLTHGGALIVAVLLGTFLGDTFAHLVGSLIGRRKLAPTISPNKTIEGLLAGMAGGTAAVVAFALVSQEWLEAGEAALLGLAVALAAPTGDLLESALKREAGVKDSGRLLGPHGGMLDRVDALLLTLPVGFYVALLAL